MITYKIPEKLEAEINALEALIADYNKGIIDKTTLKAHRVPFGVYEQRTPDTYMVRVRCAGGVITPAQLAAVAENARNYGSGRLHITTRQEVQIHDVALEGLIPAIRSLKDAGLSTRGGGGNTLRNITAPANAGISREEPFDVTPYVVGLTEHMISDGESWNLPRKFKIAFSHDVNDGIFPSVNDLGFFARTEHGVNGFTVFLGGGMGARPSTGVPVIGFVTSEEILSVALAARSLFAKYGNRKNRHAARLRFVKDKYGAEKFVRLFHQEWEEAKKSPPLLITETETSPRHSPEQEPVIPQDINKYEAWKKKYTREQKSAELYSIEIPVILGDLSSENADTLARFLKSLGDDVIRFTTRQNILLRNIPGLLLGNIYEILSQLFELNRSPFAGGLTVCAGASTCQLGICLSRGAALETIRLIEESSADLDGKETPSIKISGCPNSCGQHWTADIGFYGTTFKKDGRLYPAYVAVTGAKDGTEGAVFAERIGEIPAKSLPAFILNTLKAYRFGESQSFREFLENGGKSFLKRSISDNYSKIPGYTENPSYYTDWNAEREFSLDGRGAGECSAGVFDLLERDLKNIAETKAKLNTTEGDRVENLTELLFFSCRMLLFTRGLEAASLKEAALGFNEQFILSGIVDRRYKPLLDSVLLDKLAIDENLVYGLSGDVVRLYESMDGSMNFPSAVETSSLPDTRLSDRAFKDLRGVACPMNFVKTKMELAKLETGTLLEIYLDDGEPIQNVPGSVKSEGHAVLTVDQIDGYWKVLIRKGG
jgi:sulfite reductase (ferredoxin)